MTDESKYQMNRELLLAWVESLVKRREFPLANKLHAALEIAENSAMLYSEMIAAYRDVEEAGKVSKKSSEERVAVIDRFCH